MNYLEIPLDVTGVNVEGVAFAEEGQIFVTITSMIEGTACHIYGQGLVDFLVKIVKLFYAIYPF
ncbi:MAG: hypothetical protein F9K25_16960 [Candidatus Contendobacter sp.]|nr:MAG: hypothetical protein F9K25_16960 [Candidatus Contendobacter sp.]